MRHIKFFLINLVFALALSGCGKTESLSFSREEFEQIKLNADKSNYSNSVNLKGGNPGKMCYIEETGSLFYSDSSGLYQTNGEDTVRLLDEPAMSLNIANGSLYFIIPEGENNGFFGKVYRISLADGKKECIIDDDISNISVYKDRIFYMKTEEITPEEGTHLIKKSYYKCGLDSSGNEQISDFSFSFDGDICVTRADNEIKTIDLSNNEAVSIADEPEMVSELSIYNGYIYYIRTNRSGYNTSFVKISLEDNSMSEYKEVGAYFEDYGFIDSKPCVYAAEGGFYLLEGESLVKYECFNTYSGLYSCGSKLYGLKPGGKLCELCFNDMNGIKSVSEIETEVKLERT